MNLEKNRMKMMTLSWDSKKFVTKNQKPQLLKSLPAKRELLNQKLNYLKKSQSEMKKLKLEKKKLTSENSLMKKLLNSMPTKLSEMLNGLKLNNNTMLPNTLSKELNKSLLMLLNQLHSSKPREPQTLFRFHNTSKNTLRPTSREKAGTTFSHCQPKSLPHKESNLTKVQSKRLLIFATNYYQRLLKAEKSKERITLIGLKNTKRPEMD